jgi:hypothetical protein
MQTNLTLQIEEELIQQTEIYAKNQNKSLSQLVSDYFQQVTKQSSIPPRTKSLIGILQNSNLDEANYKQHLQDKYL